MTSFENNMMTVLSGFWLITAASYAYRLIISNPKILSIHLYWGIMLTVFRFCLAASFYKLSHGQNVGDGWRIAMLFIAFLQAFDAIKTLIVHPLNIMDWLITILFVFSFLGVWHHRSKTLGQPMMTRKLE